MVLHIRTVGTWWPHFKPTKQNYLHDFFDDVIVFNDRAHKPDFYVGSVYGGVPKHIPRDKLIIVSGENKPKCIRDCIASFTCNVWKDQPGNVRVNNSVYRHGGFAKILARLQHPQLQLPKTKVCLSVVANKNAHFRNDAINRIRNTIHVDRSGIEVTVPWGPEAKVTAGRPYKFMIAIENSRTPSYCTEKINDAFLAGCIPIYWGDPEIDTYYNPKAFINIGRYDTFKDFLVDLKAIHNDDQRFMEMLMAQPKVIDYARAGFDQAAVKKVTRKIISELKK